MSFHAMGSAWWSVISTESDCFDSHTGEIAFQSSKVPAIWFGEPLDDLSKIPLQLYCAHVH
jgi:hypothetical protein